MALTKVTTRMIEGTVGGGSGSGSYVSVKDYGAIGSGDSGVADTAAFKAIAAAGVRNIYIPTGVYKINEPIVFNYQVRIIGDGPEGGSVIQSRLDLTGETDAYATFVFTGTQTYVESLAFFPIEGTDKIIYCSSGNQSTFKDVHYDGQYNTAGGGVIMQLSQTSNVLVEDCTFKNGWRETQYDSSTGYEVVGNNATGGINVDNYGESNVKILNCKFINVWTAVKANNVNDLHFCNNYILNTADTVIFDRCTVGVSKNKYINYNTIINAGKGAIKIMDGNNLTALGHNGEVIGNIIQNYGVRLATAAIFSKNNYDFPNGPYLPAASDDMATNLVISNNTITQDAQYNSSPIDLANVANVTVTGNNITFNYEELSAPDTAGWNFASYCSDIHIDNNIFNSASRILFYDVENVGITNNVIKFTNDLGNIRFNRRILNGNVSNNLIELSTLQAGYVVDGINMGNHEPNAPTLDSLLVKDNVINAGFASTATYHDYLTNFVAGGLSTAGAADWPNALRSVVVDGNVVKFSDGQKVMGDRTLGRITNVKEFGAVGNGSVDDTDALQKAFNVGGQVYIPAGEYLVTRTLTVSSGTKVYGDGARVSIIKEGGNAQDFDTAIIENSNYNDVSGNGDITIEEIGVVGKNVTPIIDDPAHPGDDPNDPPVSANNRGLGCIGLRYVTSSNIRNCYFSNGNFGAGFITGVRQGFTSNFNNTIENCVSFNMQSYSQPGNTGHPRGYLIGCDDTRIIGCTANNCSTGFYAGGSNITFDRCKAYNWTKDNGFYVILTDSTISNCVAKGNVTGSGFAIAYGKRVSVSNCRAENCGNMGFRFHAPQSDTQFNNCIAKDCGYGFRAENTVPWTGSNLDFVQAVDTSDTNKKLFIRLNLDVGDSGFDEKQYVNISGANEEEVNGTFLIDTINTGEGYTELVVDCEALTSSFTATGTIEVRRVCSDIQINNCHSDNSTLDGFQLDRCADVSVSNISITKAGRDGLACNYSRKINISGVTATNITEFGVNIAYVRMINVINSSFRDSYYSSIIAQYSESVNISNIVMDRAANVPPSASYKGVVSFFEVKGIYVNNVTGRSVRSFWVTNLTNAPDTVSFGVVRDCQRTDLSERPAGFRTVNAVGNNVVLHETGAGDPTGVVNAGKGSTYIRTDGAGGTTFYVKETDYSNNSWTAK